MLSFSVDDQIVRRRHQHDEWDMPFVLSQCEEGLRLLLGSFRLLRKSEENAQGQIVGGFILFEETLHPFEALGRAETTAYLDAVFPPVQWRIALKAGGALHHTRFAI